MMNDETRKLTDLIEEKGILASAEYGAPEDAPYLEDMQNMDPWTVTLSYEDRTLTIPFYTGYGLRSKGDPTAYDVLTSILSDASSVENTRDIWDWAEELGYTLKDGRKIQAIYNACVAEREKLMAFLGEDYETFLYAEE